MAKGYNWYNENENRSYPIYELASKISICGKILPDWFLVDASICSNYDNIYLRSAIKTDKLVSVSFVSDNNNPVGCCTISLADFIPYHNYKIFSINEHISGYVAFGNVLEKENFNLVFNKTTLLDRRCIIKSTQSSIHSFYSIKFDEPVKNDVVIFNSEYPIGFNVDRYGIYQVIDETDNDFSGDYYYDGLNYCCNNNVLFKEDDEWYLARKINNSYNIIFYTKSDLPDCGVWKYLENNDNADIIVKFKNLVYVELDNNVSKDFLGPCSKISFKNNCGEPFVRIIGKARTNNLNKSISIILR